MKTPIIKYSDKFLDSVSWFMKVGGITLWPYIVLRERLRDNKYYANKAKTVINHESIHIKQQQELLIIPFYIWYLTEWFIRLFLKGKAYRNISFEREAYTNQGNPDYLKTRKRYSFLKHIGLS
jgi:hypothetical protein